VLDGHGLVGLVECLDVSDPGRLLYYKTHLDAVMGVGRSLWH
jgi:hypothetical protein